MSSLIVVATSSTSGRVCLILSSISFTSSVNWKGQKKIANRTVKLSQEGHSRGCDLRTRERCPLVNEQINALSSKRSNPKFRQLLMPFQFLLLDHKTVQELSEGSMLIASVQTRILPWRRNLSSVRRLNLSDERDGKSILQQPKDFSGYLVSFKRSYEHSLRLLLSIPDKHSNSI